MKSSNYTKFVVLYRTTGMNPLSAPAHMVVEGRDVLMAEDACTSQYLDADIVWVVETDDVEVALADYYNS